MIRTSAATCSQAFELFSPRSQKISARLHEVKKFKTLEAEGQGRETLFIRISKIF
jgi:hypothetical protein